MRNIIIDETRDFKGVWIPEEIYVISELSWTEKILLIEIISLHKLGKCYASNQHFANMVGVTARQVSKIISKLDDLGYVKVDVIRDNETKEVIERILTPMEQKFVRGIEEKFDTGIEQKFHKKNTLEESISKESILKEFNGAKSKDVCSKIIPQNNELDYGILRKQIQKACEDDEITDEDMIDDISDIIEYYFRKYHSVFGEDHTRLKHSVMREVVEKIACSPSDIVDGTDVEMFIQMIDKHFETQYENCDYHIMQFLTDGVLTNRFYETCY